MLKMLTMTALAVTLAVVGVAADMNSESAAAGSSDDEQLAEMPVCDEVVVTAERPDWFVDEVVVVAERPDSTPNDSTPQMPWSRETEVAGRHTVLPTAAN